MKNRIKLLGIAASVAVMVFSMAACKQDQNGDGGGGDFDYSGSGNSYIITRYRGKGGNVTIPGKIDGYTIDSIADEVFANNSNITGVTIASSITNIGNRAFRNCGNLSSVNLESASLVTIGSETFSACPKLISVTFKGTASCLEDTFLGNLYSLRDTPNNTLGPGTYTTTAPVTSSSTWSKKP